MTDPDGSKLTVRLDELVDKDGFTLLHMACFRNKTKTIEALLKKGQEDLTEEALEAWINMKTT